MGPRVFIWTCSGFLEMAPFWGRAKGGHGITRQHSTVGFGVKTKLDSPCICDIQDLYDIGPDSERTFPCVRAVLGIKEMPGTLLGPREMAAVIENLP